MLGCWGWWRYWPATEQRTRCEGAACSGPATASPVCYAPSSALRATSTCQPSVQRLPAWADARNGQLRPPARPKLSYTGCYAAALHRAAPRCTWHRISSRFAACDASRPALESTAMLAATRRPFGSGTILAGPPSRLPLARAAGEQAPKTALARPPTCPNVARPEWPKHARRRPARPSPDRPRGARCPRPLPTALAHGLAHGHCHCPRRALGSRGKGRQTKIVRIVVAGQPARRHATETSLAARRPQGPIARICASFMPALLPSTPVLGPIPARAAAVGMLCTLQQVRTYAASTTASGRIPVYALSRICTTTVSAQGLLSVQCRPQLTMPSCAQTSRLQPALALKRGTRPRQLQQQHLHLLLLQPPAVPDSLRERPATPARPVASDRDMGPGQQLILRPRRSQWGVEKPWVLARPGSRPGR